MKLGHALTWLIAVVLFLLFGPLVVGKDRYWGMLEREYTATAAWFGQEQADELLERSKKFYDGALSTLPVVDSRDKAREWAQKLPKPLARRVSEWFDLQPASSDAKSSTAAISVLVFAWRLQGAALWLGYLLPILAALLCEGWVNRMIRHSKVAKSSPMRLEGIWHTSIAMAGLTALLVFVAVPLSPWIFPVTLLCCGAAFSQLLEFMQSSA